MPQNILLQPIYTKWSMLGLEPSAIEEGAEGSQNGLKGPPALH